MIDNLVCSSKACRPDGAMKRRTRAASGPRRHISFRQDCTTSFGMCRVPKKPAMPHMSARGPMMVEHIAGRDNAKAYLLIQRERDSVRALSAGPHSPGAAA